MNILHLAYEDPRQPGAGGGSIRTREINRRLAQRHQVTALVAGYPGARPRVEDGVTWLPVGPKTGGKLDRLAYFGLLAPYVLSRPHDLLVEDFGAPFSVGLGPLLARLTGRPLVASVQWLFASEMRTKYHLPFDRVERAGLRFYRRFVAVSGWLAEDLRRRRPDAQTEVVPNGIEPEAFAVPARAPEHLLFVGRLDLHHKGGDLLLESLQRVKAALGAATPPLLIVGDGPDKEAMRARAEQGGLADTVRFCGRVEGAQKFELMARAHAVLMPSRFETFGMVAVESQAAGAPLVAFDVGPLAEVSAGGGARLVRAFDVDAFAREVVALVQEPQRRADLHVSGRRWARRYNWDALAKQQEAVYERALQETERSGDGARARR